MNQKDLTLFFVWCWFELLKKRENHARYMREYNRGNPEKKAALDRRYYEQNREKSLATSRRYALANPSKTAGIKRRYYDRNRELAIARTALWQKENKGRRNQTLKVWGADQRARHTNYAIRQNLSSRIYCAVKADSSKSAHTLELLGCTVNQLKDHLSKQFAPGMSWENYGLWHIDHVQPCARFDLTNPEQQRLCFHYLNLQPLWAKDNLSKGAK